ncbi:MAG TPA: HAMP domain-containing sensor histidine kinase, partial [Polyangiales bacterium]
RIVLVRTLRQGEHALLQVHDNGPGVPARDRARVFDPYFTTKGDGTGLGLPIVKKVVLEHGGEIVCGKSELGGAEFSIELPLSS